MTLVLSAALAGQEADAKRRFREAAMATLARECSARISMEAYATGPLADLSRAGAVTDRVRVGFTTWCGWKVAGIGYEGPTEGDLTCQGEFYFNGNVGVTVASDGRSLEWHDQFIGQQLPLWPHQALGAYANTSLLAMMLSDEVPLRLVGETISAELHPTNEVVVRARFQTSNNQSGVKLLGYEAEDPGRLGIFYRVTVKAFEVWSGDVEMPAEVVVDQRLGEETWRRSWMRITEAPRFVDGRSVLNAAREAGVCVIRREVLVNKAGCLHLAVDALDWLAPKDAAPENPPGGRAPMRGMPKALMEQAQWPALDAEEMRRLFPTRLEHGLCGQMALAAVMKLLGSSEPERAFDDESPTLRGDEFLTMARRLGLKVRVVEASDYSGNPSDRCLVTFQQSGTVHHATVVMLPGGRVDGQLRCWSPPMDCYSTTFQRVVKDAAGSLFVVVEG